MRPGRIVCRAQIEAHEHVIHTRHNYGAQGWLTFQVWEILWPESVKHVGVAAQKSGDGCRQAGHDGPDGSIHPCTTTIVAGISNQFHTHSGVHLAKAKSSAADCRWRRLSERGNANLLELMCGQYQQLRSCIEKLRW